MEERVTKMDIVYINIYIKTIYNALVLQKKNAVHIKFKHIYIDTALA